MMQLMASINWHREGFWNRRDHRTHSSRRAGQAGPPVITLVKGEWTVPPDSILTDEQFARYSLPCRGPSKWVFSPHGLSH
jgi:hypothetical protein